jgi:hypothetical protein
MSTTQNRFKRIPYGARKSNTDVNFGSGLEGNGDGLFQDYSGYRRVIQRSPVRFPALLDFLRSRGSGTGSTQPREDN